MEIRVLFFGVLADVAGTTIRVFRDIGSYNELLHRIYDEYPEIIHYDYRIALNSELITGEIPILGDQDEIALLPPFAGG